MVWTYNNMESRDRKRQIDTLKIFNDCVVEVTENSEYEVEFTSGDNQIRIEVVLGPDFPNEKPILRVNPMVSHPWITPNTRDIIRAPGLLNFTTHSDLGRVVQAIIRDFKHTPPPLVMAAAVEDNATSTPAAAPLAPALATGSSIPGFDNLSNEELELMYKYPEYMDRFIEGLPASSEMENNLNKAMEDIEIIAKENLEKEVEIAEKKEALNQRINHVSQLKKKFEEKYFQHKKLTQAYTPKAIVESLHNLATQADRDAENIAKEFLAGNMDLDTFLKNYTEKRSLGLKRRIKEDRLANQLAQLNRAGLSSSK